MEENVASKSPSRGALASPVDPPAGPIPLEGIAQYQSALRTYFRRRVDVLHVEDLVQEVFANVYARRADGEIENADRYMFTVARNVLARRRRQAMPPGTIELDATQNPDWQLRGVASWASPEDALLNKDKLRRSISSIAGLPPRTRLAFLMHRFEGQSYKQIAARLGISVSGVEKHMMMALRTLLLGVWEGPGFEGAHDARRRPVEDTNPPAVSRARARELRALRNTGS